jgi:eukaryotic-like serine/threonine-protein kinase
MDGLPNAVGGALSELAAHYDDFEQNERGANGFLFFAKNRITGARVAIKFYAGEEGDARHDEPRQLCLIKNRNVLPILDARSVSDEWGYFVTPRCYEGDLDDLIATQPSVHEALDVALGICNGVSAIHAFKMLHRDLKPGNIVMHAGTPQIADFGSVRMLSDGASHVTASRHSILFRPPESFATGEYTAQGDIYQIGMVLYQLFGGSLPYDGLEYFASKDRKQLALIADPVDRSIFVDGVIRNRAESGRLFRYDSLPPWITATARRALRDMICPDPLRRCNSVADVAASLTQLRAAMENWKWNGDVAVLRTEGKKLELRRLDEGGDLYQAYQTKSADAAFRRVPGSKPASLAEVLRSL